MGLHMQPVIQKLTEKSQRTLAGQHIASDEHSHRPYAQPQPQFPPALANVHPQLAQAAEAIAASPQPAAATDRPMPTAPALAVRKPEGAAGASANAQEAWLPDIYHFGSLCLTGEERHAGAAALPTPFIPAPPRVAADQMFNFDHGALSAGLVEETSYMAWF